MRIRRQKKGRRPAGDLLASIRENWSGEPASGPSHTRTKTHGVGKHCADEQGRDQMDGGEKTMGLTAVETRARKGEQQEKKASRDELTQEMISAEEKKIERDQRERRSVTAETKAGQEKPKFSCAAKSPSRMIEIQSRDNA
jgi:hypothetical protein